MDKFQINDEGNGIKDWKLTHIILLNANQNQRKPDSMFQCSVNLGQAC